jgi:hypothetical protein
MFACSCFEGVNNFLAVASVLEAPANADATLTHESWGEGLTRERADPDERHCVQSQSSP